MKWNKSDSFEATNRSDATVNMVVKVDHQWMTVIAKQFDPSR